MDAKALIHSYTDDVARRLPRNLRNEVGFELRTDLTDELNAVAKAAGRPPDPEMALEILRKLGRPDEVAARYRPRGFNVIEPEHAPAFVKLAVTCVAVQWVLTLPRVWSSATTVGDWWLGWGAGALWWVGLLAVWFGVAGWIQRRSPVDPHSFTRPWTHFIFWVPVAQDWQPRQADVQYAGAKVAIPLYALLIVFFTSPAGILDLVLPADVNLSWAGYDADFQRWLLLPLTALMAARLAVFTFAVINQAWRARTQPIRLALWIAFVAVLTWCAFSWDIFASAVTDVAFKMWLWVFLLVNGLAIAATIRRALTRVRVPQSIAKGGANGL